MSRQKFWRQIRLPRKAGEANLPDKTYGQELSQLSCSTTYVPRFARSGGRFFFQHLCGLMPGSEMLVIVVRRAADFGRCTSSQVDVHLWQRQAGMTDVTHARETGDSSSRRLRVGRQELDGLEVVVEVLHEFSIRLRYSDFSWPHGLPVVSKDSGIVRAATTNFCSAAEPGTIRKIS